MKTIHWRNLYPHQKNTLIGETFGEKPISETYSTVSEDGVLYDQGYKHREHALERGKNYTYQTGVECQVNTIKKYDLYSTSIDSCFQLIRKSGLIGSITNVGQNYYVAKIKNVPIDDIDESDHTVMIKHNNPVDALCIALLVFKGIKVIY